jgi:signal transduction histidine kinase
VEVVVTDPGPAAAPGAVPSGGHGIAGMTERVSAWGGTLSAEPWDGGFRVCAQIPLEGAEGDLRPSVEAAP